MPKPVTTAMSGIISHKVPADYVCVKQKKIPEEDQIYIYLYVRRKKRKSEKEREREMTMKMVINLPTTKKISF